jgi:hypothetical protein
VKLCPLGTSATNCPIEPAPDDGAFRGMRIGRGNRSKSTRRKAAPVPICPP